MAIDLQRLTVPLDDGTDQEYIIPNKASELHNDSQIDGENVKDALDLLYDVSLSTFEMETVDEVSVASFNDGADGVSLRKLLFEFDPIQLNSGDATPTNVRNFEGWTSLKAYNIIGKNLFNANEVVMQTNTLINDSGIAAANSNYNCSKYLIPILPSTTYAFRIQKSSNTNCGFSMPFYDKYGNFISRSVLVPATSSTGVMTSSFTTPENAAFYKFSCWGSADIQTIQLEFGSSSTNFEACNVKTVEVEWPEISEASDNIYGGTLEINPDGSGRLTLTTISHLMSALDVTYVTSYGTHPVFRMTCPDRLFGSGCRGWSTDYKYYSNNSTSALSNNMPNNMFGGLATNTSILIRDDRYIDDTTYPTSEAKIAAFKAGLSANARVVATRATPIVIDLTAEQLRTSLGTNYIYANIGTDLSIIYYKGKETPDHIKNTIENMITGVEDGWNASDDYVAGNLVIVDHTLYRVTANIAEGEAFVSETNCIVTTVKEELDNLETRSNASISSVAQSLDNVDTGLEASVSSLTGNQLLKFVPGYYRTASSSSAGDAVYYAENDEFVCAIAPCECGEAFCGHIYGSSGISRAYYICDASMNALTVATANYELNGELYITARTAAYAVFNCRKSQLSSGCYVYKNYPLIQREILGEEEVADISHKFDGEGYDVSGIRIVRIKSNQALLYGSNSATGVRYLNILNGGASVLTSSANVEKRFPPGLYRINWSFIQNGEEISDADVFLNTVRTTPSDSARRAGRNIAFLRTEPFVVCIRIPGSGNFGTVDNPTTFTVSVKRINTAPSNVLYATGDTTDRSADILRILHTYKECKLTKGEYYVSGIAMPDHCSLVGSGPETKIILLDSVTSGAAVSMADHCTIHNCTFVGSATPITFEEGSIHSIHIGTRHGILWKGEATGSTSTSSDNTLFEGIISGCHFQDFSGGGITCESTGYSSDGGVTVSNCHMKRCGAGINISWWSEFNRFVNVNCNACYYGVINNGGNNSFANCNFSANLVGFYINGVDGKCVMSDGTTNTLRNGGHGNAVGCIIDHSGSNSGVAVYIRSLDSGWLFSGCQIFYGKIYLRGATYTLFTTINFGSSIVLYIYGNSGTVQFDNMCVRSGIVANVYDSNGDIIPESSYDDEGNLTRVKFLNAYSSSGAHYTLKYIRGTDPDPYTE